MQRRNAKKQYRLVYALGEHPYLGFLIEPHAVLLNPNGELSFTHKRLFSSTVGDYEGIYLEDVDRQIIRLLDEIEQSNIIRRYYKKPIRPADYFAKVFDKKLYDTIRPNIERRLLKVMALLPGKPLYLMGKHGYPADQPLEIATEAASVLFHFRRNELETRYFPTIKYAGQRIEFMYREAQIVINEQAWMLLDHVLYHFDEPLEGKKLTPFLQKRYISVPRATEHRYFEVFVRGLIERHHVYAEGFSIKTYQHEATPVLQVHVHTGREARIDLGFRYGPYLFAPATDHRVTVRMEYDEGADHYTFYRIRRSKQWEAKRKAELVSLGWSEREDLFVSAGPNSFKSTDDDSKSVLEWLQRNRSGLIERGFEIVQTGEGPRYFLGQTKLSIEVSETHDWFDVHALAHFGDFAVPFLQLKPYILSEKNEFPLPNGEMAIIPREWFSRYPQLFHFAEHQRDHLKLKKHHVGLLQELEQENNVTIAGGDLGGKLDQLQAFDRLDDVALPNGFRGSLRSYQRAGFNWFYFLKTNRFGGCLADDMGLGKTIQALALLQKEKELAEAEGKRVRSLVIMPTSLIYNWQREAAKFVPELNILVHTGVNRNRYSESFDTCDVIITTYGIARVDQDLLQSIHFHYLILDESQQIKNPTSKAFKVVRSLKAEYRLSLSGTPVENSVSDLWAQMAFLNPGLLGSKRYFSDEFVLPIEKKRDDEKAARLHALIKPFILRRTKQQVAGELPPKSEQIVYCEMEADQRAYYERVKSEYRNLILEGEDQTGSGKRGHAQMMLLQGLTKLRQIANHPTLIDETYKGSSAKFLDVLGQLDAALQRGNKILIFSQFVRQLAIFRRYFDDEGIAYGYLDGATTNRQQEIDRFRTQDDVRLFLISIKAGGVGLNLTEADYVFVLDPWWNPAVEQQAIDRAHRIGQQKTVFIYKFITKDTVEEKILALQERKTRIAETLITTEENYYKSLSPEDIHMLLE